MLHVQVLVTYISHTLLTKKEPVINAQIKQRFEYHVQCTKYKVGVFSILTFIFVRNVHSKNRSSILGLLNNNFFQNTPLT